MDKICLGIDIGGTKLSSAGVKTGTIVTHVKKFITPSNTTDIINQTIELVKDYQQDYTLNAIGVATAGVVNTISGAVESATENLPANYSGINFKTILEKEYNIPVFVDNDANAAAIAEHRFGAARGNQHALIVTIGTGIGTGIIINNELYRGNNFAAGECGHMVLFNNNKRACSCGKYDCWETYASGTGFNNTAKEIAIKLGLNSTIYDSYKVLEDISSHNEVALNIYNTWLDHISIGLVNLINIFDPQSIILGGSMAEFIDYEKLNKQLKGKAPAMPIIKKATLGNNAGIIGISYLASTLPEKTTTY
jgi:glucokinase